MGGYEGDGLDGAGGAWRIRGVLVERFSVLMSLYDKENPEYFRQCMKSILNQTVSAEQIVIVKDGPLTDELERILDEFVLQKPELYTIVPLKVNQGLGTALAEGINFCRNDLIARMDTDDLAVKDRFERQLREFDKDPELDICGSHIREFENNPRNIVSERRVPLDDASIKKYQRRRDAFNHMTVMYRKKMVLKAGNYQPCLLMEDTLLWVHMIQAGAKCRNIETPLVYVRVGKDLFNRRGGFEYFKKYKKGRKQVYLTGYINKVDYLYTLFVQILIALIPNWARRQIYIKVLHKLV